MNEADLLNAGVVCLLQIFGNLCLISNDLNNSLLFYAEFSSKVWGLGVSDDVARVHFNLSLVNKFFQLEQPFETFFGGFLTREVREVVSFAILLVAIDEWSKATREGLFCVVEGG